MQKSEFQEAGRAQLSLLAPFEKKCLIWLARHAPETFARAGHFLDLTDFLTYRATGALARSACTVTCKWTYLAHERRWSRDFFESVGLGALGGEGFSRIGDEVVEPGTALGRGLTAEAATAMGLRWPRLIGI